MKQNSQKNIVKVIFVGVFCDNLCIWHWTSSFWASTGSNLSLRRWCINISGRSLFQMGKKNRQRASEASSQYDKDSRATGWILINVAAGVKWKTWRVSKRNQDVISGQSFFHKSRKCQRKCHISDLFGDNDTLMVYSPVPQLSGLLVLAVGLWLRFDPETVELLTGDRAPGTFFIGMCSPLDNMIIIQ